MAETRKIYANLRTKQGYANLTKPLPDLPNPTVTIYAPDWVQGELDKISDALFADQSQIDLHIGTDQPTVSYKMSLVKPLTLAMLIQIARNEPQNTSGIIDPKYYPGVDKKIILALKDLVKHCVIVGQDIATHAGGYPRGAERFSLGEGYPTFVCDLSGLQFQQDYNSGRLVLIGEDLPEGASDKAIFKNTVGEDKVTRAQAEKDNNRYFTATFHGKDVLFDSLAYQKFVTQDFLTAVTGLTTTEKNNPLSFKFLAYGAGFFSDGIEFPGLPKKEKGKPDPKSLLIEGMILKGIQDALVQLLNTPEKLKNIKKLELPVYHYPSNHRLVEDIKYLCNAAGIQLEYNPNGDALAPTEGLVTATTNCSDPHAPPGNEMNYGSVDAMIAENVKHNLNHFNPVLNQAMKQAYVPQLETPAIEKVFQDYTKFTTDAKQTAAVKQANEFWDLYIQPQLDKGEKVGLLYAANQEQAEGLRDEEDKIIHKGIYDSYTDHAVDLSKVIGGSGQAPVFAALGGMIQQKGLQDEVHILPVPSSIGGGMNGPGNIVSLETIDHATQNVAKHIGAGFKVIGFGAVNGARKGNPVEFSIGARYNPTLKRIDGESKGWLTTDHVHIIPQRDGTFKQVEVDTKSPPKGAISQGEYVETDLSMMATLKPEAWNKPHLQTAYNEGKANPNLLKSPLTKEGAKPPTPKSPAAKTVDTSRKPKPTIELRREEFGEEATSTLVRTGRPTSTERPNFLTDEKLGKAQVKLDEQYPSIWTIDKKITGTGLDQHVVAQHATHKDRNFSIYSNQMKTQSVKEETYRAMLISFKECNPPGTLPAITTYDPEARKAWIQALRDERFPNPDRLVKLAGTRVLDVDDRPPTSKRLT